MNERDDAAPHPIGHHGPLATPACEGVIENFGKALVSSGRIDEFGLQRARRAAAKSGERLDRVVIKLGLAAEREVDADLARFLGIAPYARDELPSEPILTDVATLDFVRMNGLFPLSIDDRKLVIATTDLLNLEPVRALSYLLERPAELRAMTRADFERAVQTLYAPADTAEKSVAAAIDEESDAIDLQRLREMASEAPVIRLVNKIIESAVEARASDIHIEPSSDSVIVRYRIDGALRESLALPGSARAAVAS